MPGKRHYYSFTFMALSPRGNSMFASVCAGYDKKQAGIKQIEAAKEAAHVDPDAVLMSCSYLGHMTHFEFMGE